MTGTPENPEVKKEETLKYADIIITPLGELVEKFHNLSPTKIIKFMTSYCLAKAMSEDPSNKVKSEEVRLEYLKETGRNVRATLKSEDPGDEEDEGLFPRPD